jgi:outer membrane PBP1 activator LpoA protein
MTTKQKPLSPFGQAATQLDAAFVDFERLARELEQLEIASDKGFDRARGLLSEVDGCRQLLESSMQAMAAELDAARGRSEKAAQAILGRALEVQDRQRDTEALLQRFQQLGGMVKQITESVRELNVQPPGQLSPEEQAQLDERLPQFNEQMGTLVDAARKLMDDARAANMKALERNADSLRQSLQAARHRLNILVERGRPSQTH